jgi:hypothetical protein
MACILYFSYLGLSPPCLGYDFYKIEVQYRNKE